MRISNTNQGLKLNAIAGTYVVVLTYDLPKSKCNNLMGFAIHRQDLTENESYYLKGTKTFKETDPGFPSGSQYSTRKHPIQGFQWADYTAKPDRKYIYTVTALKGNPKNLKEAYKTSVEVQTESTTVGTHSVFFNRGLAASQEYVRRFGDISPDDVPNNKAYEWLSRGIYEALTDYIESCIPGRHSLRISAYELNHMPFLELLEKTKNKGIDLKIVFDARKDNPKIKNLKNIKEYNLENIAIPRTTPKSYISHNKFIVKLENNIPISVWTGGMNFSRGGIYGQSNVAHIVRNKSVAKNFMEYWEILSQDLKTTSTRSKVEKISPTLTNNPKIGSTCIFSPRKNLDILDYYKKLGINAKQGVFMTFAFGVNDMFKEVYENSNAEFRFALLEKKTRNFRHKEDKIIEEKKIDKLRRDKRNLFAIGSFIRSNKFDGWIKERLSGFNKYVNYVHNKFMLIDPLTDDPIVINGSANFSDASTTKNDENMVIIRGNTKVADIYFGEYFRLYSHHAFRESLKWRKAGNKPKNLSVDDWWEDHFGDTQRAYKRIYFSKVHV